MARTPDPTRVVADVDVLLADLFVDGRARQALDRVRSHSWFEWYVSDPLLDRAERLAAELADEDLAGIWRARLQRATTVVEHAEGDHPALATAYAARCGHLLTYDDRLGTARAGLTMRKAMPVSVREPDAFVAVVDPATIYERWVGETYPGPNADPRS